MSDEKTGKEPADPSNNMIVKAVAGVFATVLAPVLVAMGMKFSDVFVAKVTEPSSPRADSSKSDTDKTDSAKLATPTDAERPAVPAQPVTPDANSSPDKPTAPQTAKSLDYPQVTWVEGQTIGLLGLVNLKRDALAGHWSADEGFRTSGEKGESLLRLPVGPPPGDYRVNIRAKRESPQTGAIQFGLFVEGQQVVISLDAGGKYTGITLIDGQYLNSNTLRHEGALFGDLNFHQVAITVRGPTVEVSSDGRLIYSYTGGAKLNLDPRFPPLSPSHMFLRTESKYRFARVMVTPLSKEAPPIATGPTVNLLERIDIKRDTIKGAWSKNKDGLHTPNFGGIKVPVDLPRDYRLTVVAQRTQAKLECLQFGVMVNGDPVCISLDAFGSRTGLELVEGQNLSQNTSHSSKAAFVDENPHTVMMTVRGPQVEVSLDGETFFTHSGQGKLSLPPNKLFAGDSVSTKQIVLASYTRFQLSKLDFLPLSTESQPVVSSPPPARPGSDSSGTTQQGIKTALLGGDSWLYTTESPAKVWAEAKFPARKWHEGSTPFGAKGVKIPGSTAPLTEWTANELWLRKKITLPPEVKDARVTWQVFHGEKLEVYINGKLFKTWKKTIHAYQKFIETKTVLQPGENIIAVHALNPDGPGSVDVGFSWEKPGK